MPKWDVVEIMNRQRVGQLHRQFMPDDLEDETVRFTDSIGLGYLVPTRHYMPDDEMVDVEILK